MQCKVCDEVEQICCRCGLCVDCCARILDRWLDIMQETRAWWRAAGVAL
jgi:hypothetical protein